MCYFVRGLLTFSFANVIGAVYTRKRGFRRKRFNPFKETETLENIANTGTNIRTKTKVILTVFSFAEYFVVWRTKRETRIGRLKEHVLKVQIKIVPY